MIQLNDPSWEATFLRAGRSRPIYYVVIEKSEGHQDPDGEIDYWPGIGLGRTSRMYATGPVDWGDGPGLIANECLDVSRMNGESISEVVHQVNAERKPGGVASIPGFRFNLDNSNGYFKELEDSGINFEGRRIGLWLSFEGETDRDNDLPQFSGFVSGVSLKNESIEIRVEGRESRRDTEIPPSIFEDEVSEDDSFIPGKVQGKPIPLVFGEHDMAEGFLVADLTADGVDDHGRKYKFADTSLGLDLVGITNIRFGDEGLVDATGGFADVKTAAAPNLPNWSPYTRDLAEGIVYFANIEDETLWLRAHINMVSALKHSGDHVGTDVMNVIDGDPATSAMAGPFDAGSTRIIGCKIPKIGIAGTIEKNGDYTGIFLQHILTIALGSAGLAGEFVAFIGLLADTYFTDSSRPAIGERNASDNGSFDTWTVPQSHVDWQMEVGPAVDWNDFANFSTFSEKFLKYSVKNNGLYGEAGYIRLYETRLSVYFGIDVPDDGLFAVIQGYADTSSGEMTGNPDALVENPAHLVAMILGYFAESADVDFPSHQVVGNVERSGWKMARNIIEQDSVESYLKDLCESALLFSWTDEEGNAQVFPMSAPAASAGTSFILRTSDVAHGMIDQPTRTPMSEVVTDFIFKFKYNPVRDEFDEQLICNPDESSSELGAEYQSICAWAKYNNGGVGKKETIELNWVRDRDTAVEVVKRMIRWYSSRRWKLPWTSDLALVQVQVGDSFTIDPGWLNDEPDSLTEATFRVVKKKLDPRKDTIRFEAVQVFE